MASLEITNDNKIKVNVNSSDSWSLNVNNSNFMLKKYNGIGSSTVELKTFSNVGELFGENQHSSAILKKGYEVQSVTIKRSRSHDGSCFLLCTAIIPMLLIAHKQIFQNLRLTY